MVSEVTRRCQSESIFKKIDVFKKIQRKIPVFEKILVIIFLMGKFGQKIVLDP